MLGLGLGVHNSSYAEDWTPANLSGLVGWHRFNTGFTRPGGSFPLDGNDIERWRDVSGNNNHASKSSDLPSYNATYKAAFFDSTAESFDIPQLTLTTFSIYVRLQFTGGITSADVLMQDDTTSNNFWRIQTTESIRCKLSSSPAANYTLHSSTNLETDVWYNMGLERGTDDEMYSYLNGIVNGSSVNIEAQTKPFLVDSIHGGKDMLVSEVIITTNSLTSAERTLVDTWLSSETEG